MPTTYDKVAYPSVLFKRTHPERLAVVATLHGLTPPPLETARVLEIACGEGLNLLALAAAYPQARFEGFDLAASAIARGEALRAAAGLDNVTLAARDILEASQPIAPGSFDYIVAHGVYAWVPEPVRAGIMALIGHALAPHGVALVSYNALPGGYFRLAMRDMLLHAVDGITDPDAKIEAARALLQELADRDSRGHVTLELIREFSAEILNHHERVLFHDELGEVYAPQSLSQVVAAAKQAGLNYLGDSEHSRIEQDFLEAGEDGANVDDGGDPQRAILRKAQSLDYRDACLFRMSLFVRNEARPSRTLDPDRLGPLWISTVMTYDEEADEFLGGTTKHLNLEDAEMKAIFHRIVAASPGRLPVADLILDTQRRRMFLKLFMAGHVDLHTTPAPFALEVGAQPRTSPLVRAEIAGEHPRLSRLDHWQLSIDQAHLRALLAAADGQRTVAEIARAVDGVFPADEIVPALNAAARKALMLA